MSIPNLKKIKSEKKYHNIIVKDEYAWVDQPDILEVLKDSSKLLPDVKKYLEEENDFTEHNLKDTKKYQKILFDEIKGRIKLDDESLKFIDKEFEYWTKTTATGNYSIKLRKKIGSDTVEEIWNGDEEKEKLKLLSSVPPLVGYPRVPKPVFVGMIKTMLKIEISNGHNWGAIGSYRGLSTTVESART